MVYCAILFYQDYRNHAKSNGKSVAFFGARRLLSQTLIAIYRYKEKVVRVDDFYLDTLDYTVENISQIKLFCFH